MEKMKEAIKKTLEDLYYEEVGWDKLNQFHEKLDELIDIFQTIKEYPGLIKYIKEYKNYEQYFLDNMVISVDRDDFEKVQNWWFDKKSKEEK